MNYLIWIIPQISLLSVRQCVRLHDHEQLSSGEYSAFTCHRMPMPQQILTLDECCQPKHICPATRWLSLYSIANTPLTPLCHTHCFVFVVLCGSLFLVKELRKHAVLLKSITFFEWSPFHKHNTHTCCRSDCPKRVWEYECAWESCSSRCATHRTTRKAAGKLLLIVSRDNNKQIAKIHRKRLHRMLFIIIRHIIMHL